MSTNNQSSRKVVITGIGLVSPMGIGIDEFRENLLAGKSGVGPITMLASSATPQNMGGEVSEFTEKQARKSWLKRHRKMVKVMCRDVQLGVASAMIALDHSDLESSEVDPHRFGVDFGANMMCSPPSVLKGGCWNCVDEDDADRKFHYSRWGSGGENVEAETTGMAGMEPLWLLKYLPNMPACHIGIAADARGPNNSITLSDASGNLVLAEAKSVIQRDWTDIMISGSTGTRIHSLKTIQADMWDGLADGPGEPQQWSRPFDKDRGGIVVAEGSCSFILEEESHAKNRDATIHATLLGTGASCVSEGMSATHLRQALRQAMQAALNDANLQPADIGHINAHAQGLQVEDIEEALAIQDVFGETNPDVPVTALKSYMGTAGSGSGTMEIAGSIIGLQQGLIPKTLNYETVDPACPINVVHGEHLKTDNKIFLKLSVTRIGQASAVVVQVT